MCTCRIMFSSMACLHIAINYGRGKVLRTAWGWVSQNFWLYHVCSHYLINVTAFPKNGFWTQNVCFNFLNNSCPKYFWFQEESSDILSQMSIGLHVKYPLFLSYFNETWIFSTVFRKILKISNFIKIHPVGAELSRADELRNRHDEANCRFLQFCESA